MKYEKAEATVIEFDCEDIIVASEDCGFPQFDVDNCDNKAQVVIKPVG